MPEGSNRHPSRAARSRPTGLPLGIGLLLAVATGACSDDTVANQQPAQCRAETNPGSLPVAPANQRVDRGTPTFTNPGNVTNPLFPAGQVASVVMLGQADGEVFRAEVTLLPTRKTIAWNGEQRIQALEVQYAAFADGRLHEVALDWYAQADDGSVWYLGEDVFNYADGVLEDTGGTWIACKDGPAAMIMPAIPQVGDVYRPENSYAIVFEEVLVTQVGVAVAGPTGNVAGAIVVRELHMDGTTEDKTFAPGYGEFFTGSGADVEAVALAVPTDALPTAMPSDLENLYDAAMTAFDAAQGADWPAATSASTAAADAWDSYSAGGVSARLATQMEDALQSLVEEVAISDVVETRQAAVEVARATLDFQLRYRPVTEIDRERFDLWAAQVLVDVQFADLAGVKGDALSLDWTLDRFAHALSVSDRTAITGALANLQSAASAGNLAGAQSFAAQLRAAIAAADAGASVAQ